MISTPNFVLVRPMSVVISPWFPPVPCLISCRSSLWIRLLCLLLQMYSIQMPDDDNVWTHAGQGTSVHTPFHICVGFPLKCIHCRLLWSSRARNSRNFGALPPVPLYVPILRWPPGELGKSHQLYSHTPLGTKYKSEYIPQMTLVLAGIHRALDWLSYHMTLPLPNLSFISSHSFKCCISHQFSMD